MKDFFERSDKYVDEVIKPFLPNAACKGFLSTNISNLNIDLDSFNLFKGSQFEIDSNEDLNVIHFTSLNNLFNILRTKALWMKDLNSMEDKSEFIFANKYLDKLKSKKLKSKILSLSFSLLTKENLVNDKMWTNYGDNHNGVCIKFKIRTNNMLDNFFNGKVKYSPKNEEIKELLELQIRHEKFSKENGYSINNLNELLFASSSMYKEKEKFSYENEIRLFKFVDYDIHPLVGNESDPKIEYLHNSKNNNFNYFMQIPLNQNNSKINIPDITIEKIFLGKNIIYADYDRKRKAIEMKLKDSFNEHVPQVISINNFG